MTPRRFAALMMLYGFWGGLAAGKLGGLWQPVAGAIICVVALVLLFTDDAR